MHTLIYWVVGLSIVVLLASIIIFNGLVAKRNMVKNTFSSIDVNLKKRADLIPNLVDTVKAYAKHEKEVFLKATQLRTSLKNSRTQDERLHLESDVGPVIGEIFALSENYPKLKSDKNFLNLQRNLTDIEENISASRRAYNSAVMAQRNAIETFPSSFIAQTFSFQSHEYFEVESLERKLPKIKDLNL